MLLRFQCSKSTDNPKIYVSSAARHWHSIDPVPPREPTDTALLECESHDLLSKHVVRRRRRLNRLDVPVGPKFNQRSRSKKSWARCRQEQEVARRTGSAPASAHSLKDRGDRRRCVDLDHSVQI